MSAENETVEIGHVEKKMSALWEGEARRAPTARAMLSTILALVSEPQLEERARTVLGEMVRQHSARTIAVSWREGATPAMVAQVGLHRDPTRELVACGDRIELTATGAARDWVPETIERLIVSGVPACMWWVGDLPDGDDLFDEMVRRADVAVVDSHEMDLRDLEKLSMVASDSRHANTALIDLGWHRIRPLQDLLARFFDDPLLRPHLDKLSKVTLTYAPRPNEQDVASTQTGLFLGWLAAALNLKLGAASKWTRNPGQEGGGGSVTLDGPNGEVDIEIRRQPRSDVSTGSITGIEVTCDAGARFSVLRADDPCSFHWAGESPNGVVPSQNVRVKEHVESRYLARALERPLRDQLFESSLAAASRIVRPIAPRLSTAPRAGA